jgi:hypothetical protein
MQRKYKRTRAGSNCWMLIISLLFLLYFVTICWKHFITVKCYGVTKVTIRRLERLNFSICSQSSSSLSCALDTVVTVMKVR